MPFRCQCLSWQLIVYCHAYKLFQLKADGCWAYAMLKFAQSLASDFQNWALSHSALPSLNCFILYLVDIFGLSASLIMKLKIGTILCCSSVDTARCHSLEMKQMELGRWLRRERFCGGKHGALGLDPEYSCKSQAWWFVPVTPVWSSWWRGGQLGRSCSPLVSQSI